MADSIKQNNVNNVNKTKVCLFQNDSEAILMHR